MPPPGVELARRLNRGVKGPGSLYTDSAYNLAADLFFAAIAHRASTAVLTVQIDGVGIQDLNHESWEMDNLRVGVSAVLEPASATRLTAGLLGLLA